MKVYKKKWILCLEQYIFCTKMVLVVQIIVQTDPEPPLIILARLGVEPNQARLRWTMIFDASAAISSNRSEPMLFYCCLDPLLIHCN